MKGLRIYVKKGPNNRENVVAVNLRGESGIEDMRKVILAIKEPLEKNFPGAEVKLGPSAERVVNVDQ